MKLLLVNLVLLTIAGCAPAPVSQGLFSGEPRAVPYADNPRLQHLYLQVYWRAMKDAAEQPAGPPPEGFDDFFPKTPEEHANARGHQDANRDARKMLDNQTEPLVP